ncbi:hypothetical protein ACX40Y_06835 [Sphingomonas sp. RS6]
MTRHVEILASHPGGDDLFCLDELVDTGPIPARRERQDGWTPERQALFLKLLSEGHTITTACDAAGMSTSSAYALRRSAAGAAFAVAWQAALLLAREHLADRLIERAVHGSVETITRPDGSTLTRQRHDNRLAMHMLTRLDRLADGDAGAVDHAAARLVAGEFDQFLALIERGGGAARAGLFLAQRLEGAAAADDLAPLRALARADAWLRSGGAGGDGADTADLADLDPAQRAHWTAEQWARAEAAGLLVLAPPPAAADAPAPQYAHECELWQLRQADNPDGAPVWWDSELCEWRTSFPPDPLFYGHEEGEYGDPDYSRTLSSDELEVIEGPLRAAREAKLAEAERLRDAWFADGVIVEEVDDAPALPAAPPPPPPSLPPTRSAGPAPKPRARAKPQRKRAAKPARKPSSRRRGRAQSAGAALQSAPHAPT